LLFSADPRYTSTLLRESYPVGSPRWAGAMLTAVPRQLRVEYPGAIYHVLSRGDRQKDIYLDDVDRQDFLKTLAEACQKTGFQIHAYCLIRNHFHLVVETPNGNLVAGMRWLVAMAGRLSCETTLTIREIAQRLHMGSWKSLNNRLYLAGKENAKESKSERARKYKVMV
jgi:REP element-mobilizing transposase RayT